MNDATVGSMGWLEISILAVLALLSFATSALSVERALVILRGRPSPQQLHKAASSALRTADATWFRGLNGPEGRVLTAVMLALPGGATRAAHAMTSARLAEQRELERGLTFIGTVGANAPFVGLLGTVFGLLRAFWELSAAGGRSSETVIAAIGTALVSTAVGLAVAIPAVAFYNGLARSARDRLLVADQWGAWLVAHGAARGVPLPAADDFDEVTNG